MIAQSFEVKVAVLGNVSAGKSTVLNALLREKYSEVSMKRTTAGINYFHIFPKTQAGTSADSSGWTSVADNPRTADSTLKEITEDNAALRTRSSVQEKTFNIEVDKELVKMRKDTKLVLVDVPGINEAASSKKYKDYVASTWDSLDCVICVMDGRQGVNTEEALDLLKFVKTNLKEKKNLPVVILCNKVDDPDDDETAELVSEARAEVEKLFGVSDRKKALRTLLNSELSPSLVPVFLPISAVNAFIHQSGSHMTLQQFQKLDKYLIEKLGKDHIGRSKWKRMKSWDDKVKATFQVVQDPKLHEEGLSESNFDKLLDVLSKLVGGEGTQRTLIENQLNVSLRHISECIGATSKLESVLKKSASLYGDGELAGKERVKTVQENFWRVYDNLKKRLRDDFSKPDAVGKLAAPMEELIAYYGLAAKNSWKSEQEKALGAMKDMVQFQFETVLEKAEQERLGDSWEAEKLADASWKSLSPCDWKNVFGSFLLLSYDKVFCESFSQEKIEMEVLLHQAIAKLKTIDDNKNKCTICKRKLDSGRRCSSCRVEYVNPGSSLVGTSIGQCTSCSRPASNGYCNGYCSYCGGSTVVYSKRHYNRPFLKGNIRKRKYKNGSFKPVDPKVYELATRIEIPESLSDSNHYGHLAWKYCEFVGSLKE